MWLRSGTLRVGIVVVDKEKMVAYVITVINAPIEPVK
jgi:hypothetical protein